MNQAIPATPPPLDDDPGEEVVGAAEPVVAVGRPDSISSTDALGILAAQTRNARRIRLRRLFDRHPEVRELAAVCDAQADEIVGLNAHVARLESENAMLRG